ncbi:DUF563 domain-containing protein [Penicillium taxi]|uniref:DUF563 domain-containing protein n=1 Tax=Penicillium taxi TaxID=168475 RepID=UPI002545B17C|nr:DUF563 domain-containing protein [Penicillium taxi]KAJ5908061.1 DUF563 domain-containing protein [Penicillium taxi]
MKEGRWDTFCFGKDAKFDPGQRKFSLKCELGERKGPKDALSLPKYGSFHNYWFQTGPGTVLDGWVELQSGNDIPPEGTRNYTIFVKREGALNHWHSLMEIYSMTLTLDTLQITNRPDGTGPYITAEDAANTQVVLIDDKEDGPFFEMWSLFAKKPILRLKDVPESTTFQNIIVPLAGGSNTLWQGDWIVNSCEESALLQTFSNRVLSLYGLEHLKPRQGEQIVLTFINRMSGRRLVDNELYLEQLKSNFPPLKIQSIDFATISYKEQLKTIQGTDVLVGVHGAGLTHGIFLPSGSSMVEILPPGLNHKGFRNVAALRGHSYFSAHASESPSTRRRDWHSDDVYIEKERFMELMDVAIKALYNKGERNYDVN